MKKLHGISGGLSLPGGLAVDEVCSVAVGRAAAAEHRRMRIGSSSLLMLSMSVLLLVLLSVFSAACVPCLELFGGFTCIGILPLESNT